MYGLYRSITLLISPLMPYWLEQRRKKGKEHDSRMGERFGKPSLKRPVGKLLWVHAASVGETNAAMPLICKLLELNPELHVLLTTGTVTSADLIAKNMPDRAMHQFVPIDIPSAVEPFIEHWHPQLAIFVDSEIWPNLIVKARSRGAILAMANGRMSEGSYSKWKMALPLIKNCLGKFTFCFAQSTESADRLKHLGIDKINHVGNLKYDVPPLAYDEAEYARLKRMIGDRPVWLAASTHDGEEADVADVHKELVKKFPNLLTIIVPRHSSRGDDVVDQLAGLSVARRSLGIPIFDETDIYLADTMGELGLFYRLAQLAFIGGSLVPHGGQNPIEPLQLGCPIILGPHMESFPTVAHNIERAEACVRILNSTMLAGAAARLLGDDKERTTMAEAGQKHVRANTGTLAAVVNTLQPSLVI